MKRKHDELSSLAVKSLVCEEADEYAGLPILWRGQEVGEVGPIEPLPERVRQEPYSLPQGFHWVTLSSSDVEKVAKFIKRNSNMKNVRQLINHHLAYPYARQEWQFGIQTTDGKLVGILFATPVHMHVGKEMKVFIIPTVYWHRKYSNKRLRYMLIRELMRRANLSKINQFVDNITITLFKPVTTIMVWSYQFNQLASSQLPSSPRTPGWRRMTSKDVPSALALINKWSLQFEIRQVFGSEEEFVYNTLMQEYVITYIIVSKFNSVTDLVSFALSGLPTIYINALISTQSPVKQLIIDTLVCARENRAKKITIHQRNIESDILASLSFQPSHFETIHFYNYRYHEVSQANFLNFTF